MMNEFKNYHPIVNFAYFLFVIGFSMFFMHPVCLLISITSGFLYSVMLKGKKAIKTNLIYMLPMLIFMALINPAFNHAGITIIAYLPNQNPITLEAIIYGACSAMMIFGVICWFSCYNQIMTSDKFIYLFGRIIPGLSLIISMTLRFVPKFGEQLRVVANAQKCIGRDVSDKSIIKRVKYGLNILSVMTTWALENTIDTADSMKARGYGIAGRTAFSIYKFDNRDFKALLCIVALGIYIFVGGLAGKMSFWYFPAVKAADISPYGVSVFISYLLLCVSPIIIEIREVMRWKFLRSKI